MASDAETPEFVLSGCLKSPPDRRDFAYGAAAGPPRAPLPDKLDLRPLMPPIRNQGSTSQCVAFSAAAMKEYHERKELGAKQVPNYFSPSFIYEQRENAGQDGMFPRDAMRILRAQGIPDENAYRFPGGKPITDEIRAAAAPFKIEKYAQVYSVEELKRALAESGPVLMAFPVYNTGKFFWRRASDSDRMQGGHCVLAVGYDDSKGVLIRNSWGIMWGDYGYVWLPYDEFSAAWEVWSSVDAVTANPPPVKRFCC